MTKKRALNATVLMAIVLLAGVAYLAAPPALARQQPGRTWRYAFLEASANSAAQICYAEEDGCRLAVITVPGVPMRGEIGITDGGATTHRAMVKAMTTLGAAGWELVGQSDVLTSNGRSSVLVFKRGD